MNNTHRRVRSYATTEPITSCKEPLNLPVYNYATGATEIKPHIPIYKDLYSGEIVKAIPLHLFSKSFREMYDQGIFKKAFMDNEQVTVMSIHNTIFIPKISNYDF
jgi:hypothetical protein